jgi:5-methylthioadenosine/S-adenosylhomocysteine deaminase
VDGKICIENGIIPGVDFARLRIDAQAAGETIWSTLPEWDPLGCSADEAFPYSYPLL